MRPQIKNSKKVPFFCVQQTSSAIAYVSWLVCFHFTCELSFAIYAKRKREPTLIQRNRMISSSCSVTKDYYYYVSRFVHRSYIIIVHNAFRSISPRKRNICRNVRTLPTNDANCSYSAVSYSQSHATYSLWDFFSPVVV